MSTNIYFRFSGNNIKKALELVKESDFPDKNELLNGMNDELEIHICKLSATWESLYEKTKYYSTFDEIVDFYHKYENSLEIYDDNGNEYSFYNFLKKVKHHNQTNLKKHIDFNDYTSWCYYDKSGHCFSNNEFC